MTRDEHLQAARGILGGLAKLDAQADALALIDGAMVAGYHLGSAALHAHGVTEATVHYNTPSKFEVPPQALPESLKPIYALFDELEQLRTRYVRSANRPTGENGAAAQRLLGEMARLCQGEPQRGSSAVEARPDR